MSVSVLDTYVKSAPSDQNVIDLFVNEWSSTMPPGSGLVSTPGPAGLFVDGRIDWAKSIFGGFDGKDILELGPLEGGHSYLLQKAGARSVVAIESNSRAFLKCLCVKEVFNLDRVHFKLGDFVAFLEHSTKKFDVIIASGVLYHMTDPVSVLHRLAESSDNIFLWTHYYDQGITNNSPHFKQFFDQPHEIQLRNFKGLGAKRFYKEALDWQGFCGGSEPHAVWLGKQLIIEILKQHGFTKFDVTLDHPDHPHGPAFALCARR